MAKNLRYSVHRFGTEDSLQKLGVWEVNPSDTSKPWVIYIHGGAWRDSRIGMETFVPTIDELLLNTNDYAGVAGQVAGFASLDYRLSIPEDQHGHHVQHPDHLNDVRQALACLQKTFQIGRRYILIGHSAGACLAMQLLACPENEDNEGDADVVTVALPMNIICVSGIYDFTGINKRFSGEYSGFLGGAFGDPSGWDAVAPFTCSANYASSLDGATVTLARSQDDELVDEPELDNMAKRLRSEGCPISVNKEYWGSHDSCWEEGKTLSKLIYVALNMWKI